MQLGLHIALTSRPLGSGGGLGFDLVTLGSDGTTATLRITGTLSAAPPTLGGDGTTATLRIN